MALTAGLNGIYKIMTFHQRSCNYIEKKFLLSLFSKSLILNLGLHCRKKHVSTLVIMDERKNSLHRREAMIVALKLPKVYLNRLCQLNFTIIQISFFYNRKKNTHSAEENNEGLASFLKQFHGAWMNMMTCVVRICSAVRLSLQRNNFHLPGSRARSNYLICSGPVINGGITSKLLR